MSVGPHPKSRKPKRSSYAEAGQLSIFLGVTVIAMVSFLAFVINVGLFVKSKINLQNSVDAAAFAGASVQARQLSNIAYLNWELRNTYKEWMFKYYVLGQKGLDATINPDNTSLNNAGKMNFRLRPFYQNPSSSGYDANLVDRFNMPSICIHYGSPHNICEIVSIPGLPRFNAVGLPSISHHHEAFLNSIVKTKSEDCSNRSNINLGATMLWAYGSGKKGLWADVPLIATSRPGAWIEALELGLRMRNLEAIVNFPPVPAPICYVESGSGCQSIQSLESSIGDWDIPYAERPMKAFWSAFRNLSGGAFKGKSHDFAHSFSLTELKPKPLEVNENSLSGFLIPSGSAVNGTSALTKHYLDLQVYPLNLVTFYTTFVSSTGNFKNSGVSSESDCAGVKTALPVPGYIFGFTKNPEVVTYYAVKGEAKYIGLFYPFADELGIKLKAYAAAKPFGGRIGPKLFKINNDGQTIEPREEAEKRYTANYVSALDLGTVTAGASIEPGMPIPFTDDFWASSSQKRIGGNPTLGNEVFFGVPNLIYDWRDDFSLVENSLSGVLGSDIQVFERALNGPDGYNNTKETAGLYTVEQFKLFKENEDTSAGPVLDANQVLRSLFYARRPTKYDAANYMFPILDASRNYPLKTQGMVYVEPLPNAYQNSTGTQGYRLFAPLYGAHTLYTGQEKIKAVVNSYINVNKQAIDKFIAALKEIADQMRAASTSSVGGDAYVAAADTIHREPINISGSPADPACQKLAMAQKLHQFFQGSSGEQCGIKPLELHFEDYMAQQQATSQNLYPLYYTAPYEKFKNDSPDAIRGLLTAFVPGPRQGATVEGTTSIPFGPTDSFHRKRNFYSTKFIPIDKFTEGGSSSYNDSGFPTFLEGNAASNIAGASDIGNIPMRNLLNAADLSEFGKLFY